MNKHLFSINEFWMTFGQMCVCLFKQWNFLSIRQTYAEGFPQLEINREVIAAELAAAREIDEMMSGTLRDH